MSEQLTLVAEAPAAPPPPAPPAEGVIADVQNPPAESAAAPAPDAKPAQKSDDENKGSRRFERRISQAIRRAAEARAEADVLRRQLDEVRQQVKPPADPNEPRIENFSDIEEYAKAKAEHATKQSRARDEQDRQTKAQQQFVSELTASWEEKVEKFSSNAEDFDTLVGELKPVNALTVAIMDEDNGPQVAYHLAKNPTEAHRIAGLPHWKQAKEIARLAVKLAAEPPKPKKPSGAPAPISPVQAAAAANTSTELKDGMDYKDFVKVRNRQLGRNRS